MRKHPALRIVLILLVGLAVGIAVKAVFFSDPPPPEAVSEEDDKTRQQLIDESAIIVEDVELVQGKQGAMDWKMLAISARYNQEKKLIGVERPQLTAYFGDDRQEVYIKADRGEVDQSEDNLVLYDNIAGRFGTMEVIAQHLDYVGTMNKVYLKGGVTVRRPDMTLTANTVEIDLITRQLVASGNIKALLSPKGLDENPFNQ